MCSYRLSLVHGNGERGERKRERKGRREGRRKEETGVGQREEEGEGEREKVGRRIFYICQWVFFSLTFSFIGLSTYYSPDNVQIT